MPELREKIIWYGCPKCEHLLEVTKGEDPPIRCYSRFVWNCDGVPERVTLHFEDKEDGGL